LRAFTLEFKSAAKCNALRHSQRAPFANNQQSKNKGLGDPNFAGPALLLIFL
jgi:hypothetical protein